MHRVVHECRWCTQHSWVNIARAKRVAARRGARVRVGLQLYIYHAGIQHCARNPDGMPIGRRNVVTPSLTHELSFKPQAVANFLQKTRFRRCFPRKPVARLNLSTISARVQLIARFVLISLSLFTEDTRELFSAGIFFFSVCVFMMFCLVHVWNW